MWTSWATLITTSPSARTVHAARHGGRWKAGRDGAEVHAAPPSRAEQGSEMVARNIVHAPPRTDKGKGKARAVDEAMEVDIDGIDTPGQRSASSPPAPRAPTPSFPPAARAGAVGALRGPIAERQLRTPQPHVPVSGHRGPASLLVFSGCGCGRGRPRPWGCAGPAGAKPGAGGNACVRVYICRCGCQRFSVRHTHTTARSSGSIPARPCGSRSSSGCTAGP
ncbi:hypothetical protein B0H19DRAFT_1139812 [Mycena capillaripes]|nr:hypothetical protein B0H19DRAFT_1139812 [Mycena capillaripes]